MEELVLEAQLREGTGKGKVKELRRQGFIPGVLYGERKKTQLVKVDRSAVLRLVHEHRVESAVINLKLESDDKKVKDVHAIIKEIQFEPVKEDIVHIDFNRISLTKAIKVKVPIEPKGESIGVKQEGGSLEHVLWDLEIECLPTQIPEKIEVDISALKIGDAIHVKDISLPLEVKVLNDPEAVVFNIAAPVKEEVTEAEAAEVAPSEPEVIKEKKKEEEATATEGKAKEQAKDKTKEEKA
jgi:large subunit ribosomal protein L25